MPAHAIQPQPPEPTQSRVAPRRAMRAIWIGGGFMSVGVGSVGVVVPGLPTTVFFVIAAWCFSRSSPRFEQWVLGLPGVGQLVRDHRDGLGMPRASKRVAIGMMWTAVLVLSLI
ncbi:MAG: YbaN family protein, partial [Ilumatobacteraceae bacterium]